MSAGRTAVRRALLYVPGSSQKMLDKTKTLTADCVAYDLEDSVTPSRKSEARSNIRRFLEQPRPSNLQECAVRINAVGTGFEAKDIEEVVRSLARGFHGALNDKCYIDQYTQSRHHRYPQSEFSIGSPMGC